MGWHYDCISDVMKIVFAVPNSGCAYWRCKQPNNMIQKLGLAESVMFHDNITQEETEKLIDWGDVVVFQSAMGIPMVATVAKLKKMGKTVVGDYDDWSFSLSPFNPAYKTLGLNEVKIKREGEEITRRRLLEETEIKEFLRLKKKYGKNEN